MVNGKRHGRSKSTWRQTIPPDPPTETVFYLCFNMGKVVKCGKSASSNSADSEAIQILSDKYPWFKSTLNAFKFNDEFVEDYIDTIETLMYANTFDIEDFGDVYDDAISACDESRFDSLTSAKNTKRKRK